MLYGGCKTTETIRRQLTTIYRYWALLLPASGKERQGLFISTNTICSTTKKPSDYLHFTQLWLHWNQDMMKAQKLHKTLCISRWKARAVSKRHPQWDYRDQRSIRRGLHPSRCQNRKWFLCSSKYSIILLPKTWGHRGERRMYQSMNAEYYWQYMAS